MCLLLNECGHEDARSRALQCGLHMVIDEWDDDEGHAFGCQVFWIIYDLRVFGEVILQLRKGGARKG